MNIKWHYCKCVARSKSDQALRLRFGSLALVDAASPHLWATRLIPDTLAPFAGTAQLSLDRRSSPNRQSEGAECTVLVAYFGGALSDHHILDAPASASSSEFCAQSCVNNGPARVNVERGPE
jgi:hypothetical protein